MDGPLISFVIPCYNYGRYLRDCVDRIFALEGGYPIEVIAVNDASPDDTIDILRSYADPRLKIIDRRENRGHIFTVNEGFAAATGKYVVRIDPDDRHHPCFLLKTVPVLEADERIGLAYGNVNIIGPEGQLWVARTDKQHGGKDFRGNELVALLKSNFICAPTVIARREAWMSAWPVPEGLAFNDWYFNLMLARKWDYFYCDTVLADYRVHGSNHHSKISKDGSEERSVVWLLNKFYSEVEDDAALEGAKQAAKGEVYAAQYRDFAMKYFGFGMHSESRRCFFEALRWNPQLWGDATVMRYLLASLLPRAGYEGIRITIQRLMLRSETKNDVLSWRLRLLQRVLMRVRPNTLAAFLKRVLGVQRVTVPTPEGRFHVDPVSLLGIALTQRGEHEPGMIATFTRLLRTGATLVDLGANEGYFTVIGARLCGAKGKVIAIEPQRRLLSVIEENLRLNGSMGVTLVNAAVTDKPGSATLYLTASTNTGGSGLHNRSKYALPTEEVATQTLEQILDAQGVGTVDLMKVDIEGFEYEALLGSPRVFEKRRVKALALELHPTILAHRGKAAKDITDMLERFGYTPSDYWGNAVWLAPSTRAK